MTLEEKLKAYYGKHVKVYCTDNIVITGFYCIYTRAIDNDDGEGASIMIETKTNLVEIYENEIEDIELL